MDNILWALGGFIVGWYVHRWVVGALVKDAVKKLASGETPSWIKDIGEQAGVTKIESKVKVDDVIEVKVEEHHGHFYLFRADNDKFLAQGATFKEVKDLLVKAYPETTFTTDKSNKEITDRLKATS